MSRAFVSEDAATASADQLPDRPITPGPNPVTQRGLAMIDAELDRLHALHEATETDDPSRPAIARDLRYWRARRASAQPVPDHDGTPEEVVFGSQVRLRRTGNGDVTYRIVGEDEADPAQGLLSWSSPLAEALLGARVGEVVETGAGRPAVKVLTIAA
jgi:transcription elongation GreA/GreB family factor